MRILAIETSCDETAVAVLDGVGTEADASFTILGETLYSQVQKHAAFGGVYPSLAKREHAQNLTPLTRTALTSANLCPSSALASRAIPEEEKIWLRELLRREDRLCDDVLRFISEVQPPDIDAIAVTSGPGLEPALWVGVNFAKALARVWNKPLIPVNHLEGHLVSAFAKPSDTDKHRYTLEPCVFPLLGLVASGGHTELVYTKGWGSYEVIGRTRDDAVGEAFDKVARMMGLPYPGGAELSRLAHEGRRLAHQITTTTLSFSTALPRPMLRSNDFDFSFSGLKTAVLYLVRDLGTLDDGMRKRIAVEFETAVADVFAEKVRRAVRAHPVHTFVIGGGVSANQYIRARIENALQSEHTDVNVYCPPMNLTGDNAIMIGMAGYLKTLREEVLTPSAQAEILSLRAEGGMRL